jgi:hypothetical protein
LVSATIAHPDFFSKEALAGRKRDGETDPEWLQAYLADVWVPTAKDLRPLRKMLASPARRF